MRCMKRLARTDVRIGYTVEQHLAGRIMRGLLQWSRKKVCHVAQSE